MSNNTGHTKKTKVLLIVGKKGSGKTYLAKRILEKLNPNRLLIFDPLGEYTNGLIFYDFAEWATKLEETESFRHILRFDNESDFFYALEVAYEVGDLWIIIEEVTVFANEKSIDKTFDKIIRFGRHKGVNIIGLTQRCANIPRLLTSQMDGIVTFRQTEPRDLEYLYRVVGEGANKIKALGEHEHLTFIF